MIKSDNSAAMLLGSIMFQFDTGNHVEYLVHVVNPVLGNDGIKVTCNWTQEKNLTVSTLGYFENVNDGIKAALETWEGYIMKDEMPECVVTGALDAEDVRDMMLYIQEPELWEEGETPPTIEPLQIDVIDFAIQSMRQAVLGLWFAYGMTEKERFSIEAEQLDGAIKLLIDLRDSDMEGIESNE